MKKTQGVAFFAAGPIVLSIYGRDALEADAGLDPNNRRAFAPPQWPGTVRMRGTVDAVLALAAKSRRHTREGGAQDLLGRLCRLLRGSDGQSLGGRHIPISTVARRPADPSRLNIAFDPMVLDYSPGSHHGQDRRHESEPEAPRPHGCHSARKNFFARVSAASARR